MTFAEPPINPEEDTRPRPAANPTPPSIPTVSADDQVQLSTTEVDETAAEPETRGGCSSPLMAVFVLVALLFMCIAMVSLAGVAGYRDGVNDGATQHANTQIAAINTQMPHIAQDEQSGRWDVALERCRWVATLRPNDPAMVDCMNHAQQVLSATPTPSPTSTPTQTPIPPTATASPIPSTVPASGTPAANGTTTFLQSLLQGAKDALNQNQFEKAAQYLEAIREADGTFDATEVMTILCSTYETLGRTYQGNGQLSEMVVVINKALAMNCKLQASDWSFTVDVTELYLSAKGYLDAGNYTLADTVFRRLMSIDTGYLDSHNLACQAFGKAGDTSALQTYNCK